MSCTDTSTGLFCWVFHKESHKMTFVSKTVKRKTREKKEITLTVKPHCAPWSLCRTSLTMTRSWSSMWMHPTVWSWRAISSRGPVMRSRPGTGKQMSWAFKTESPETKSLNLTNEKEKKRDLCCFIEWTSFTFPQGGGFLYKTASWSTRRNSRYVNPSF